MNHYLILTLIVLAAVVTLIALFRGIQQIKKHEARDPKIHCYGCARGHTVKNNRHVDGYGNPYMFCRKQVVKSSGGHHGI